LLKQALKGNGKYKHGAEQQTSSMWLQENTGQEVADVIVHQQAPAACGFRPFLSKGSYIEPAL